MPAAIVDDNDHLVPWAPPANQLLEKGLESVGVEGLRSLDAEPSIPFTHRPEKRHRFVGGSMQDNGIKVFWRDPRRATRSMLEKVALVFKP